MVFQHCSTGKINPDVDKSNPKKIDTFVVAELGEKTCFCRCWRSKKFPLCDGSHGKHNKETGDNVGPVIVMKKKPVVS